MITTNNCCFCLSLKTGCMVIGVLQLIGSLADFITTLTNGPSGSLYDNGSSWPAIILDVIQIFAASCLIFGVYTARRRFIFYYLFVAVALFVLRLVLSIVVVATGLPAGTSVAAIVISLLLVLAILAYMLIVVYSHYMELSVA